MAQAAGDRPGTLELVSDDLEAGASQATVYRDAVANAQVQRVTVPATTLDAVVTGPVDMIKLDVQGHESAVFDGGRKLFEESPPSYVVIELQGELLEVAGSGPEQMLARLEALGYRPVDGDGVLGHGHVQRPLPVDFFETVVFATPEPRSSRPADGLDGVIGRRPGGRRMRRYAGRVKGRLSLPFLLAVALWLGLGAGLAEITRHVSDWFVMTDELLYERLALSIDRLHSPLPHVHAQSVPNVNQLYPLLLSIVFRHGAVLHGFHEAHVLNAFVMSSAAVPTYLLARRVAGNGWLPLVAAVATVAVPWMTLSSFLLTEVVAYPAFIWAALAMHARSPGRPRATTCWRSGASSWPSSRARSSTRLLRLSRSQRSPGPRPSGACARRSARTGRSWPPTSSSGRRPSR